MMFVLLQSGIKLSNFLLKYKSFASTLFSEYHLGTNIWLLQLYIKITWRISQNTNDQFPLPGNSDLVFHCGDKVKVCFKLQLG